MENSQVKTRIHFIGIGGIGMSALARYYLSRGFEVSGSDLVASEITETLEKQGVKISIGSHQAKNIAVVANLVVYSAAVESKNPEFKEAKKRKIKCQTYAQALGELTKEYFTIAVSGTHGKSTTTAMIALIMVEAGLDPTVVVGTKLREFGDSNFRAGQSKYLVIEADEYAASFLNYWPKIVMLTNIEADHLDFYKDLANIVKTFEEYVKHLGPGGVLVANEEDLNIEKLVKSVKCKVKSYSEKLKVNGLNLKIPGQHNLLNAYAAITTARQLGVPDETSVKALNNFHGAWRRFEYRGEINGAKIFDDYGHHPTEIKATLQGAREYLFKKNKGNNSPHPPLNLRGGEGRLWCIFQPHQYQRTYKLFDEFVGAFGQADKVILLPIYSVAGREKESIKKKVSSEKLAQAIKSQVVSRQEIIYFDSFEETAEYLCGNLKIGDIAVVMGAGDVYKLTQMLLDK